MNLQDMMDTADSMKRSAQAAAESPNFDPKTFVPRNPTQQRMLDEILIAKNSPDAPTES